MESRYAPGSNHWSITVFARDPETGMAKWADQLVPHDSWDYDEIMENILVDMPWEGQERNYCCTPGARDLCTSSIAKLDKFFQRTNTYLRPIGRMVMI